MLNTHSIIIPVHNESENLASFVEAFVEALPESVRGVLEEIILVENGSTDSTLEVCRQLSERHPDLVRTLTIDRGSYGEAIRAGMLAARGKHLSILECDFLDPEFVAESIHILDSGKARFVVASKRHPRSIDKRPLKRRLLTFGFNEILRQFLGYPGTDTHGLKSIDTELAHKLCHLAETTDELFQTEIVLIAWRLGEHIEEVPIRIDERRAAPVSIRRRFPKVMNMVFALRRSLKRFPVVSSDEPEAVRPAAFAPKTLAYYALTGVLALLAFIWVTRLYPLRLEIPLTFFSDGLITCLYVKPFLDGETWWAIHRLGAPFYHNLFLFPIGANVDYAMAGVMGWITGDVGRATTFAWMLQVLLTAGLATWCLRRLNVSAPIAMALGILYAFIPYTLHRNMRNLNLSIYLVPVLCTFALLHLQGLFRSRPRAERWFYYLCCVLTGFNSPYTAFFACYLFAMVATLCVLVRAWNRLPSILLALALIMTAGVINLTPSLIAWHTSPEAKAFLEAQRDPTQVNTYGWTLRDALLPHKEHPWLGKPARESFNTYKPDGHARGSTMGVFGAVCFVVMLLSLFLTGVGKRVWRLPQLEQRINAAAAATLGLILLATVGGLSNFVALWLIDTIRYYWRVTPFIEFFSFCAMAWILDAMAARWRWNQLPVRRTVWCAALAMIVVLGIQEQKCAFHVYPRDRAVWYDDVAGLVKQVEQRLPGDAMVYQLPDAHFYIETSGFSDNYPQLRPYLLSKRIRWSYAPLTPPDRCRRWHETMAACAPSELPTRILLAGFDGVWIDRRGYADKGEAMIALFTHLPDAVTLHSETDRYVFVDLSQLRKKLIARMGTDDYLRAQDRILADAACSLTGPTL